MKRLLSVTAVLLLLLFVGNLHGFIEPHAPKQPSSGSTTSRAARSKVPFSKIIGQSDIRVFQLQKAKRTAKLTLFNGGGLNPKIAKEINQILKNNTKEIYQHKINAHGPVTFELEGLIVERSPGDPSRLRFSVVIGTHRLPFVESVSISELEKGTKEFELNIQERTVTSGKKTAILNSSIVVKFDLKSNTLLIKSVSAKIHIKDKGTFLTINRKDSDSVQNLKAIFPETSKLRKALEAKPYLEL